LGHSSREGLIAVVGLYGQSRGRFFPSERSRPDEENSLGDSSRRPNLRLLKESQEDPEQKDLFWLDRDGKLLPYKAEELLAAFEDSDVNGDTLIRIKADAPSRPLRRYMRELVWIAHRNASHAESEHFQVERYEAAFDHAPIGMILSDLAGRIEHANEAFCRMLGYGAEELEGMRVGEISGHKGREQEVVLGNEVLSGKRMSFEVEKEFIARDGGLVETLLSISMTRDSAGQPLRVVGHVLDLRRRKRLERDLVQAERFKSIGQLSGGIAHDFNNILQVCLGMTGLLRAGTEADQEYAIGELETAVRSGQRLTNQLMAFARQGPMRNEVVDLNKKLRALEPMIRTALGRRTVLRLQLSAESLRIKIDPMQLEQAIMNIVFNAAKAMPDGGELNVETRLLPDEQFTLTVQDTGAGMDEDVCARAFEPYFTTRQGMGGTGLGLAMVYGIITGSGGAIRLDSQPNVGTTCTMLWKRYTAPDEDQKPSQDVGERSFRCLAVDGEPSILRMIERVLRRRGIDVDAAGTFGECVERIQVAAKPYAIVVCESSFSDASGIGLVDLVREHSPSAAFLFTAADVDALDDEFRETVMNGHLLSKPFLPQDLVEKVEEILEFPALS
jgi:two-component system, cell cycle sensor histidine kinase and response regulator CckA